MGEEELNVAKKHSITDKKSFLIARELLKNKNTLLQIKNLWRAITNRRWR